MISYVYFIVISDSPEAGIQCAKGGYQKWCAPPRPAVAVGASGSLILRFSGSPKPRQFRPPRAACQAMARRCAEDPRRYPNRDAHNLYKGPESHPDIRDVTISITIATSVTIITAIRLLLLLSSFMIIIVIVIIVTITVIALGAVWQRAPKTVRCGPGFPGWLEGHKMMGPQLQPPSDSSCPRVLETISQIACFPSPTHLEHFEMVKCCPEL